MVDQHVRSPNAPVQARWANAQRAGPAPPNPPTVACNRLLSGPRLDAWLDIATQERPKSTCKRQHNQCPRQHDPKSVPRTVTLARQPDEDGAGNKIADDTDNERARVQARTLQEPPRAYEWSRDYRDR